MVKVQPSSGPQLTLVKQAQSQQQPLPISSSSSGGQTTFVTTASALSAVLQQQQKLGQGAQGGQRIIKVVNPTGGSLPPISTLQNTSQQQHILTSMGLQVRDS